MNLPNEEHRYDGDSYDPKFDNSRLDRQLVRVYDCMIDGNWRTLKEIAEITCDPEPSISARLRDLRKQRFGSYIVNRKSRLSRTKGLFEYQLLNKN